MQTRKGAFSLSELLVVLTIVVILLALLAPALSRASDMAEVMFCASNQHAIGRATAAWLADHKHAYPVILNYGTLLGNQGRSTQYGSDKWGSKARPLNIYLGYAGEPVRVAECPADIGDALSYEEENKTWTQTQSSYDGYGTSYVEAFANAKWGVKPLFGQAPDPTLSTVLAPPTASKVRSYRISHPHNKIVLGDWPFYGDRRYDRERSRWHNEKERQMNMLFADLRVEFYAFPNGEMEKPTNASRVPDPSFYWW